RRHDLPRGPAHLALPPRSATWTPMGNTEDEAAPITWDIRREGRSWTAEEFTSRVERLLGVDVEVSEGKLFGSERTRQLILGMLREHVGLDAVVRLGALAFWKEAIAAAEWERGAG